jgi:uncharacterized protein (DUF1778 family)
MIVEVPQRSERITVRFRPHELELLAEAATLRRIRVSEYVRDIAVRDARFVLNRREVGRPEIERD